jgi:hypothetical protein
VGKDPQVLWPGLVFTARVCALEDPQRALELAREVLSGWQELGLASGGSEWLGELAIVLDVVGKQDEFLEAHADEKTSTPWLDAAAAYAAGDFDRAADAYAEIGALPQQAYARLRAAERLVREGQRAEADARLEPSLAFWRSVDAKAYVREGEALLAASA